MIRPCIHCGEMTDEAISVVHHVNKDHSVRFSMNIHKKCVDKFYNSSHPEFTGIVNNEVHLDISKIECKDPNFIRA